MAPPGCAGYVFGHDRDAMLSRHRPATAADEAARREAQAAELGRQIARNQASAEGLRRRAG